MKWVIFKTINSVNNKLYIGRTTAKSFNFDYKGSDVYIREAVSRFGISNFETEVIEEVEDKVQALERQNYWIDYYNSSNPDIGYNSKLDFNDIKADLSKRIQVLLSKNELDSLNELSIKEAMTNGHKPYSISKFVRNIIRKYIAAAHSDLDQKSYAKEAVKKHISELKKDKK